MSIPTSTKKRKSPQKPGKAQLIKKADKYFSLYIRYRDGEKRNDGWYSQCITCSRWLPLKNMQCGHFQSRSKFPTRWDEQNCNAQCIGCNMFKYGEQYKYALAVDMKYGDGTATKLAQRANEIKKWSISELEEIINDAKLQIKFYEEQ